ncbi:uncharacterized protein LOC144872603 isoform X2 [Branchiostoma floridae x Branchiostoma japonicum]
MTGTKRSYDNRQRTARRHRQHGRESLESSATRPVPADEFYHQKLCEVAQKLGYIRDYTHIMSVIMNPHDFRNQPLYPGSLLTVLQAVTAELHLYANSQRSRASQSKQFWNMSHLYLPPGNRMPDSMEAAEKMIQDLILKTEEYHVCQNDCIVYRKEHEHLTSCPVCGTSRYKAGGRVPRKKFIYLPIIPRIRQMFEIPGTAQALQSHWPRPRPADGVIRDLHDSPAWAEVYGPGGTGSTYSMWPGSWKILNLPAALRNKTGCLKLAIMIPGPREPKNLNPYLQPLVDELLMLEEGVWMYDASRDAEVKVRAEVMLNVMDYPGQCKTGKTKNAGAISACNKCWLVGQYSKPLQKVFYIGHRRLLHPDNPLRTADGFPEAGPEHRSAPRPKKREEMMAFGKMVEEAPTTAQKNLISKATGKTGVEEFYRLETHGPERFAPEMMHLTADVGQRLVRTVTGENDTLKVRLAEQQMKRFPSTWPGKKKVISGPVKRVPDSSKRSTLPPAPWALKKGEKVTADKRLVSVKVPIGFGWNPKGIFVKYSSLKSHDWMQLTTRGILPYSLRNTLGDEQRNALFRLCDVLGALNYPIVRTDKIPQIQEAVDRCLVLLERHYPGDIMVTVLHQLTHQPEYLARYGPARDYWMFIFERMMHYISTRVTNRRYPEASVIKSYLIDEFVKAMQHAGALPEGAISPHLQSHQPGNDGADSFQLTHKKRKPIPYTLPPEQLEELTRFYLATKPSFTSMIRSLQKERSKAGSRQPLKEWTPARTLSEVEREVVNGPSSDAEKYFAAHMTICSRPTEYRCEEVEERGRQRSSYVGKTMEGIGPCFGRIQYFIRHRFMGTVSDLAYVKWLPRAERDEETSLFVIDPKLPSPPHQPFLAPVDLSHPLVTAEDPDNGALWVLDYDNVLMGPRVMLGQ